MSLKPIQEGRLKSTVKKKTVKNLRLVGRLEEGLFRTGALSQVIKASDRLWKKVKFRKIFWGKFAKKLANFARNFCGKFCRETMGKKQPISLQFFGQISLKLI